MKAFFARGANRVCSRGRTTWVRWVRFQLHSPPTCALLYVGSWLVVGCKLALPFDPSVTKDDDHDFVVIEGTVERGLVAAHKRFLGRVLQQYGGGVYRSLEAVNDMIHTCQPSPHAEADSAAYVRSLAEYAGLNRLESTRYIIRQTQGSSLRLLLRAGMPPSDSFAIALHEDADNTLGFELSELVDLTQLRRADHLVRPRHESETQRDAMSFSRQRAIDHEDILGAGSLAPMRVSGDTQASEEAQRTAAEKLVRDVADVVDADHCHTAPGISMNQEQLNVVRNAIRESPQAPSQWKRVTGLCALRVDDQNENAGQRHSLGAKLLEHLVNDAAAGTNVALFSNRNAVRFYQSCFPRCTVEANFKPEGDRPMMRHLFVFPPLGDQEHRFRCDQPREETSCHLPRH